MNVLFGLAAGLALGVGLALLRDRMSGRLRSSDEVEEYLEAPVLGVIPQVPDWRRRKRAYLVSAARWRSPAAEAYRVLRTNLLSTASTGAKSIVVTSTHSGEGKSATVANLGVVLARAGKSVTLVSADLRRPRLHEFFRRDGRVGLSDVLAGRLPLDAVVQEVTLPSSAPTDLSTVSLRLVSSGPVPEDPAELLGSPAMAKVIEDLERVSDIVLIDVPPVLPVTDAPVVAAMAKNVLLVIGPNSATRASVVSARQQLERVGARILGGVSEWTQRHQGAILRLLLGLDRPHLPQSTSSTVPSTSWPNACHCAHVSVWPFHAQYARCGRAPGRCCGRSGYPPRRRTARSTPGTRRLPPWSSGRAGS